MHICMNACSQQCLPSTYIIIKVIEHVRKYFNIRNFEIFTLRFYYIFIKYQDYKYVWFFIFSYIF